MTAGIARKRDACGRARSTLPWMLALTLVLGACGGSGGGKASPSSSSGGGASSSNSGSGCKNSAVSFASVTTPTDPNALLGGGPLTTETTALPLGTPVVASDGWTVCVVGFTADATSEVESKDSVDPPGPGLVYALVETRGTYNGTGVADTSVLNPDFTSGGQDYSPLNLGVGSTIGNDPGHVGKGASVDLSYPFQVPSGTNSGEASLTLADGTGNWAIGNFTPPTEAATTPPTDASGDTSDTFGISVGADDCNPDGSPTTAPVASSAGLIPCPDSTSSEPDTSDASG